MPQMTDTEDERFMYMTTRCRIMVHDATNNQGSTRVVLPHLESDVHSHVKQNYWECLKFFAEQVKGTVISEEHFSITFPNGSTIHLYVIPKDNLDKEESS